MLDIKEIEKVLGCNNEIASFIAENDGAVLDLLNSENSEYFFNTWCDDDIINRAVDYEENNLTEKDLKEIKSYIKDYTGGESGITWLLIDDAIQNRIKNKYNELKDSLINRFPKIGDSKNFLWDTYLLNDKQIILFDTEEDDNKWCVSKYWLNENEEKEFFDYFTGTLEECIYFIDNKLDRILN